jgi:hypothetical protein
MPKPIPAMTMRLDGAGRLSLPRAEAGTMVGNPRPTAAAIEAVFKNSLLEIAFFFLSIRFLFDINVPEIKNSSLFLNQSGLKIKTYFPRLSPDFFNRFGQEP